jgi:hypothetical protein
MHKSRSVGQSTLTTLVSSALAFAATRAKCQRAVLLFPEEASMEAPMETYTSDSH